MPSGKWWRRPQHFQFVVAIPNTKLRIGAEGGLARPIDLPATYQLQLIAKPLSVDANAVP